MQALFDNSASQFQAIPKVNRLCWKSHITTTANTPSSAVVPFPFVIAESIVRSFLGVFVPESWIYMFVTWDVVPGSLGLS